MDKDKTNIEANESMRLAQEIYEHGVFDFDMPFETGDAANPTIEMVRIHDTIQRVDQFGNWLQSKGLDTQELVPVATPEGFPGWKVEDIADYHEVADLKDWIAELKEQERWW